MEISETRVTKVRETFEIQRKNRLFKNEEWSHYNWIPTWEKGNETIGFLRTHKSAWIYQLIRNRTTVELTRLA